MQKMTLQDLKAIYPPPSPKEKPGRDGKVSENSATQKRHRHKVNPVWLPAKLSLSPAEYRRRRLGKKGKI